MSQLLSFAIFLLLLRIHLTYAPPSDCGCDYCLSARKDSSSTKPWDLPVCESCLINPNDCIKGNIIEVKCGKQ